jgi:hypothetical protein
VPTKITASPAIAGFRFHCRDKIEPNLQSPNVHRTHSVLVESRFQRGNQNSAYSPTVNAEKRSFLKKSYPLSYYSEDQALTRNLPKRRVVSGNTIFGVVSGEREQLAKVSSAKDGGASPQSVKTDATWDPVAFYFCSRHVEK